MEFGNRGREGPARAAAGVARRQALLGAALLSAPALSQPAAPPAPSPAASSSQRALAEAAGPGAESIVVTARRFEERLQDVPIAVSALAGDDLLRQGVSSLRDVATQVPGYSFETLQPLVPQTVIRGQTNLRADSPVQNVAYFLDGVYLQRAYLVDQRLIELERLEVIKGPQSALYGRNAFAGAVSMVSRSPDLGEIRGRASATVGTDERYEGRGYLSVPLVPGRLAVLVGGGYSSFDGTWTNNHPLAGAPGVNTRGKIGGWDNWAFQGRVIARPADSLTIDALYIRTERDEETVPSYTVGTSNILSPFNTLNASPRAGLTPPFAVQNRLWVGAFPADPVVAPQDVTRPAGIVIDPRAFGVRGPTELMSARIAFEPGGPLSAQYLFGRAEASVRGRGSPSPNPLFPVVLAFPGAPPTTLGVVFDESGTDSRFRGQSHEIKITARGNERWNAFFGVNWSNTRDIASNANSAAPVNSVIEPDPSVYLFPVGPGLPFPNAFLQRTTFLERDEDIFSGFAFLELRPIERLIVTVEGRYTVEDQKATDFLTREPSNPAIQALSPPVFQQSLDYFTPRLTLSWRLAPDHLLYGSAARGVKAGGLNGNTPFVGQRAYANETNWTYEIGAKSSFGRQLTLNVAAYRTDWSNLQTSVVRLQANGTAPSFFAIVPSTVGNIGAVEVWGGEVEASWRPVPPLQLFGGLSYSRSRYKEGSVSQRFGASGNCDGVVCRTVPGSPTAVLPVGGNQLERVPDWNAIGGANVNQTLANGWGIFARGDVTFKSRQFMDEANLSFVPSRTLVNAALGLNAGPVELTLWARNLFDERYVSTALFLIGTNGALSASYVPTLGERRTMGLTASFGF